MKSIIILSNKSSGSSACQKLMSKFANVNLVEKTYHYQNETLYWTKAASILGLPQNQMLDSSVPYSPEKSYSDIVNLLKDNLGVEKLPDDPKELIFQGWAMLCKQYAPIFLEKSPHHLYQWSAIELILECIDRYQGEIDFLLIGLVRNPMDTLYSAFRRWKTPPERCQYEWLTAYQNLQKIKEIVQDKLVILRYEDIVSSVSFMNPVLNFCGVDISEVDDDFLYKKSVPEWKTNKLYGFNLADEVVDLAKEYGYTPAELTNESSVFWPTYRDVSRNAYQIVKPLKMKIVDARLK